MVKYLVEASKKVQGDLISEVAKIDDEFERVTGLKPTETGFGFGQRDVGAVVDGYDAAMRAAKVLEKAGFKGTTIDEVDDD